MPSAQPVYVVEIRYTCCGCKFDNGADNHVQCIICHHVLDKSCCTKKENWVLASH